MEFLDIKLTKDSMLFTVPSTGGFLRKPYSSVFSGVENPYKKNPRSQKT
jgi:hypothetical protein